jgi:basic membrane protein A
MTARFNRRYFLVTGSAALTGSVLLKAFSKNSIPSTIASPVATSPAKPIKAAIGLPGVITDKAWN